MPGPRLPIVADAKTSTEALVDALRSHVLRDQDSTSKRLQLLVPEPSEQPGMPNGRDYVDALRTAIPRDGILSTDMTQMAYIATYLYPVYEPRTFMFPSGYGTLGFALPAAIGAKIARPDAMVVAVVGDGGFQYTMAELGCAVQERLGLPIVIFNDSTYSAVKMAQARVPWRTIIGVDLVNPDYVELAKAYGIPGGRVTSPAELIQEIRCAAERNLPTIIDVPIEPWV